MKALIVVDYLSLNGSDDFANWAKSHVYIFEPLYRFEYIGHSQLDRGKEVRTRAKALTSLLEDKKRLQSERDKIHNYSRGLSMFERWESDQEYYNSLGR